MPYALVGGAVAAAGTVAGSLISSSASKSAADASAQAANNSAALQKQMFDQTQANLLPYNTEGQKNLGLYGNFYQTSAEQLGQAYNNAFDNIPTNIKPMTQEELVKTPGYQFNLSQGLRAIQNSNAAQGLGVSGAALQGAGQYATGLADSTYQNQFANQQTLFGNRQTIYGDYLNQANLKQNQLNTIYGQIGAPVSLGENAAASAGNNAVSAGSNIGNAMVQAGNAQAAGITGSANNLASGLSGAGNIAAQTALLYGLQNTGTQQGLTSAAYQYANPYGATGAGNMIVGNNGLAGGGV